MPNSWENRHALQSFPRRARLRPSAQHNSVLEYFTRTSSRPPRGGAHFYRLMHQMRTRWPEEDLLIFLAFVGPVLPEHCQCRDPPSAGSFSRAPRPRPHYGKPRRGGRGLGERPEDTSSMHRTGRPLKVVHEPVKAGRPAAERRQCQGHHHDARRAEQAAPSLAKRIASSPHLGGSQTRGG